MGEPRTNLPLPLGRFVGRASDLDLLQQKLVDGERLITITGAAGMGKTRLAVELAQRLVSGAFGEVWFCDLTDASDASRAAGTVARVLDVPIGGREGASDPLERIGHALAGRARIVLVLDNFEQLLPSGREIVASWLRLAPSAQLVVTSRERLRLDGESVHEVGPLGLPEGDSFESEAVELLIDRVRRRRHTFRFEPEDRAMLGRIVERLDGNPLAIELAAARLALLGAPTLVDRLDKSFSVLASHGSTETLRTALDWSWSLCGETEREALAQCSVFRGGFGLQAAEAVLSLGDASVLDVLESLFDKSLLRADDGSGSGPEGRFSLFLSVRHYAAKRLNERGGAPATAARHASYYSERGLRAAREATGHEGRSARAFLMREHGNLREVVEHATDPENRLRAAIALAPALGFAGPLSEYARLIDRALEFEGASAELRAEALVVRGDVRRQLGEGANAEADLMEARALARASSAARIDARAASGQAAVALARGELEVARKLYEEALDLLKRSGEQVGEACALASYGAVLAGLGRPTDAKRYVERARDLHERLGNQREQGLVTAFLGNLSVDLGELEHARVFFAQAEAIHEEVADPFGRAFTRANLAVLHHRLGRMDEAREAYETSLAAFRAIGALRYAGAFLGYRALLAWDEGEIDRARYSLEDAIGILDRANDKRFSGLYTAYLAGLVAESGDLDAAKKLYGAAESKIEGSRDPFLALAVDLQRAFADVAEGSSSKARERIARAYEPGPDGSSPVELNADVFFAVRAAERAVGNRTSVVPPLEKVRDHVLGLDPNGEWFAPPGATRIDLGHRDALRRALLALAKQRVDNPGKPLSRDALVAQAWPGERMLPAAAGNRLRVAIATLRKLGLSEAIKTNRSGYFLDPDLEIDLAAPDP